MNIFVSRPPYLLILTFTFMFWPLTPLQKVQINTLFITAYHVANYNWANSSKFSVFQGHISSKGKQSACYQRLYMSNIIPEMISLNFAGLLQHSTWNLMMSPVRHATFNMMAGWWHLWTLNDVYGQKLAFYRQFVLTYDRACILDGIIYHFINFRKSLNVRIRQF